MGNPQMPPCGSGILGIPFQCIKFYAAPMTIHKNVYF